MEDKIRKALNYAFKKHNDQYLPDGSGRLYIDHCINVAKTALDILGDDISKEQRQIIGATALLHDTLEDTKASYNQILKYFGQKIANNVLALTKNYKLPSSERMGDSLKRIVSTSKEAAMVKMADRIVNITHLHPKWDYEKSKEYLEEARLIYDALHSYSPKLADVLNSRIENYSHLIDEKWNNANEI